MLAVNENTALAQYLSEQERRSLSILERHELETQAHSFGQPGGKRSCVSALPKRHENVHVALRVHLAARR